MSSIFTIRRSVNKKENKCIIFLLIFFLEKIEITRVEELLRYRNICIRFSN